jgi:TolA-binding protein
VADDDHGQDIEDLTREHAFKVKQLEQELYAAAGKIAGLEEELKRREMAYKFMSQTLAQHVERISLLSTALNTGTVFVDQLMADLRIAGREPSAALKAAHAKWNNAMKKLFGHDH